MPLLAINLSQAVLSGMQQLIDAGKYTTLESLIEVACFNQLALERSGGAQLKNSGLTLADRPKVSKRRSVASASPKKRGTIGKIERQVYLLDRPDQPNDIEAVLKPFRKVASEATPRPLLMGEKAQGDHIFGQVNRLLPMKLVCRWLMRDSISRNRWPLLSEASEVLADAAARLGSLLEQQDFAVNRKRDECLATGLPRRSNGPSKDRFLSQFVARVTRSGHIFPGATCQYKLASIEDQTLALSQRGMDFALIENPLLDSGLNTNSVALNDEEGHFLRAQILEWAPQEHADIQAAIGAIDEGSSTPSSLTAALRNYLPSDWNDAEIQTHVSGLIARMSELKLLSRRWHGRHVEYELSNVASPRRGKIHEAG